MEGHAHPHHPLQPSQDAEVGEKGLKKNAIGFLDGLIIGIASTAPAYSLAAVLAIVVGIVGVQSPAVLLASFVPMFLIAASFYYMNRADPDCGTTFSWITRAMGPGLGWVGGWAVCTTGIIIIGSLAQVAVYYTCDLLSLEYLRDSRLWQTVFTVGVIALMTLICVLGTELSARVQRVMILAQVGALLLFATVALIKVAGSNALDSSIDVELSWFSPFAVDSTSVLVLGMLSGFFLYWGWESAVNLNEETEDSDTAPGLAAIASTVILLVTYVATATAVVAFAGLDLVAEYEDDPGLFGAIAPDVLGGSWDWIVVLAIITSALASTQTTILPASRTALSMARQGAYPAALGQVHPRFLTPHVSTIVVGLLAALWFAVLFNVSENFLFDSLTSLSLMVAFYYALNGFACAIYYRRELTKSVKNFLFIGLGPVIGAGILGYLFFKGIDEYGQTDQSYTGNELFGLAIPAVLAVGLLILGVVLMLLWRATGHEGFFGRKREVVDPDVAAGRKAGVAAVPEESV